MAGRGGRADGELPPSLRDTLLARVELLGEPAQQVLAVVAVAGAAVPDPLLGEVAGLPEGALLAGLREAVSAHVLLADAADGTYRFRHALVKEAVYAELLPGERTRLHARFAAALAATDGAMTRGWPPSWPGTGTPPTTWSGPCRRRSRPAWPPSGPTPSPRPSASSSGPLSCGSAPARPREGSGWTRPSCWPGREAAANAGAADRAVALVRGALAEVDAATDPLVAGQLTERLAFHLRVAGRPGAFEAYQEAVRLVPPGPTVARARVLAGLGQALMLRARFAESIATCQEAIEVARAAGSRVVEAHALNSQGTAMARLNDPEGAWPASGRRGASRPSWARPRTRCGPASTCRTCWRTSAAWRRRWPWPWRGSRSPGRPAWRGPSGRSWPGTPPPCTTWAAGRSRPPWPRPAWSWRTTRT